MIIMFILTFCLYQYCSSEALVFSPPSPESVCEVLLPVSLLHVNVATQILLPVEGER